MKHYFTTLTIAGSDPSGGAGIQADLKTFSALGCYGMSVITALTAQNTVGVQGILPIDPTFILQQLTSITDDITISAIKIGMLHNTEIITSISKHLALFPKVPIVLDPVMVAKGGECLLENEAITALINHLLPIAAIITPNIPEAELLLNTKIANYEDMATAAKQLAKFGSKAVLLKGGHLVSAECRDCLYVVNENRCIWFTEKRIETQHTHGTGCTLSAAIAAYIAQGHAYEPAVAQAKKYLTHAIEKGQDYQLGHGIGPVAHF